MLPPRSRFPRLRRVDNDDSHAAIGKRRDAVAEIVSHIACAQLANFSWAQEAVGPEPDQGPEQDAIPAEANGDDGAEQLRGEAVEKEEKEEREPTADGAAASEPRHHNEQRGPTQCLGAGPSCCK